MLAVSSAAPERVDGSFTIALTGDSIVTRHVADEPDAETAALYEILRGADVAFTNLEVLPNDFRGDPAWESGGSHFAAPPWVISDLKSAGFNLFACANNHSLDYSITGLVAAIEALEASGVDFAGIGRNLAAARMPAYADRARGSVALLACCSTFVAGQHAGDQRPEMQGRPGLNPLRFDTVYELPEAEFAILRGIATGLGLEQQRLDRIRLGFEFPPEDPATLPFLGSIFRAGPAYRIETKPNARDLQGITKWLADARQRADLVVVSFHGHEQGAKKEDPAEFTRAFARHVIDEGADVVIGHGPHLLRGLELYRGKPIFYSLGNFFGQNELVYKLPADAYERFRSDPDRTPAELYRARYDDDRKSFPADPRFWETVVATCHFDGRELRGLDIAPVELGFGAPPRRRGRPRRATGDYGRQILERFAALSAPFGVTIMVDGDTAHLAL